MSPEEHRILFHSPRRWGGVGLAVILLAFDGLRNGFVSIPSEVGRGRALSEPGDISEVEFEFQSPQRWGGVGLVHLASPAQRLRLLSFNPLGGGAGSGSTVARS